MDKERLKELALAATPGEWMRNDYYGVVHTHSDEPLAAVVRRGNTARADADMAYIAAASPETTLALIRENERNDKYSASRYQLDLWDGLPVEAVHVGNGKWKIQEPFGDVMRKDGDWEPEPRNSDRGGDFLKRTRFDSVEEAFKAWKEARSA